VTLPQLQPPVALQIPMALPPAELQQQQQQLYTKPQWTLEVGHQCL
jgi:hypothetical protein